MNYFYIFNSSIRLLIFWVIDVSIRLRNAPIDPSGSLDNFDFEDEAVVEGDSWIMTYEGINKFNPLKSIYSSSCNG